jgi:cytoskeleton protein RodZ
MLRAAREKQGLHIAALAAAIKVSPRKLDALENDRWHELPDATFVRALAQTVCRTLKIEARPVLALLPITGEVVLEPVSNVLNEPFRDRPGRDSGGFGSAAVRPMVGTGLLLLLAAVVVYFLPASLWSPRPAEPVVSAVPAMVPAPPGALPASAPTALPAAVGASAPLGLAVAGADTAASVSTMSPVTPPGLVAAPGGAASALPMPVPLTAMAALASTASAPSAALNASVPVVASASAGATPRGVPAASPVASATGGLLQVRSTQASWVDVRDARGTVLLSRTVFPGEAVGLDGALPLRLTIGNAAATQLSFRGRVVDMTGRVRENVARLELQ